MNTQDLIENAVLDAHGLLDESERSAFETAFAGASPSVQAQVRAAQTRLSNLDLLLPDVAPPAGLRAAVLEAVRGAIAEAMVDGSAEGHGPLRLVPSQRVSPLWRAIGVAGIAATLAMGVAMLQMYQEFSTYQDTVEKNTLLDEIARTYGSRFVEDTLFDPQTRRVVFEQRGTGASDRVQASLWYNPDWNLVRLFCLNLDADIGAGYRLAVVDDRGHIVQEIHRFQTSGGLEAQEIAFDLRSLDRQHGSLAILPASVETASGEPVLTTPLRLVNSL